MVKKDGKEPNKYHITLSEIASGEERKEKAILVRCSVLEESEREVST